MDHSGAVDVTQGLREAGSRFAQPVRQERAVAATGVPRIE
ncbi:hypothetical protein M878_30130 [Streptomyces roseochromogenus subsp. oscitans DS 12.976]|uniref:Uncharacterized protein n=1 Tax=Streptomyces roseochromogenus subsp. oscitans DS 12.976 TaxID=1352936 RepID=V6JXN1_STRRC|nr:hypothetical protein M878_30130 [Streptomyces roseochromogenus subsp. oscitans DS 12.976]